MDETKMPEGREGVIKRETSILNEAVVGVGGAMTRKTKGNFTPIEVVKATFLLFLVFYGFFALTNPQTYPILGNISSNKLDPLFGLIMMVVGVYFLFKR